MLDHPESLQPQDPAPSLRPRVVAIGLVVFVLAVAGGVWAVLK